jgi:hypothetical protein
MSIRRTNRTRRFLGARLQAPARAAVNAILGVTALAAGLGDRALAESGFAFEPLVAHVQEAERLAFRSTAAGDALAGLSGVGTVEAGALSVAAYEVVDDVLQVVFRLAGSEPAELRHLALMDAGGRVHDVPVGRVMVRPAVDAAATPLVGRGAIAYGDGVILGAWLFENESDGPVVLRELDIAPPGLGRPFVLARTTRSVPSFTTFERWVDTARRAVLAAYDGAPSAPAPAVESALRAAFPSDEIRASSAPELHVPAGGAVGLILTPASLAVDLATTALQLDVRIVVRTADGDVRARFLPHLVRYAPNR